MLNSNMSARYGNMTYELGKWYTLEGDIVPYKWGYHFCKELDNCLEYYDNIKGDKRFFEIKSDGEVIDMYDKSVTNKIILVRELSIDEVLDYFRKNKDTVDWYYISIKQKLPESFIREMKDYVNWYYISSSQKISEDFIREFKDYMDWDYISSKQILSEDFIKEMKDYVDWGQISYSQELSEDFIREFKDYVDWDYISYRQEISEDFIREFKIKN